MCNCYTINVTDPTANNDKLRITSCSSWQEHNNVYVKYNPVSVRGSYTAGLAIGKFLTTGLAIGRCLTAGLALGRSLTAGGYR